MLPSKRAAGFTLVEVLVAMFVLILGATGVMSIFSQGQRLHGDARRMTRATAIAQDLIANIDQWPYDTTAGTPLANVQPLNDADVGDAAYAFETTADPVAANLADHAEGDLPATFAGIPAAGLGNEYQRYWNVAPQANATGGIDALLIAVVVRWPSGSKWHRVVLYSVKPNPATVH
jgi:prepilin-type N-terminal cleavage/methylation domain-containing protein